MASIQGTYNQVAFRVRNDDGSETTATWVGAQDANVTLLTGKNYRLRYLLDETGASGTDPVGWQLEVAKNGGAFQDVTGSSTIVRSFASPNFADKDDTTSQLTGSAQPFKADNDGMEEVDGTTDNKSPYTLLKWEVEYCVQLMLADLANGDTIVARIKAPVTGTLARATTLTITVSVTPVYEQNSFRFRNDDGSETTATYIANLNTNVSRAVGVPFRLRNLVKVTLNGETTAFTYKYSLNGGAYTAISNSSSVCRFQSSQLSNGADTTQQIGAGAYISDNNSQKPTSVSDATTLTVVNKEFEPEGSFILVPGLANNDTVDIRLYAGGAALGTYTQTGRVTASVPSSAAANAMMTMTGPGNRG